MQTWGWLRKTAAIAARVRPDGRAFMTLLVNPANPALAETATKEVQAAALNLGLELHVLNASTERDFDENLAKLTQLRAGGLVIGPDVFFTSRGNSSPRWLSATRYPRSTSITSSSRPAAPIAQTKFRQHCAWPAFVRRLRQQPAGPCNRQLKSSCTST